MKTSRSQKLLWLLQFWKSFWQEEGDSYQRKRGEGEFERLSIQRIPLFSLLDPSRTAYDFKLYSFNPASFLWWKCAHSFPFGKAARRNSFRQREAKSVARPPTMRKSQERSLLLEGISTRVLFCSVLRWWQTTKQDDHPFSFSACYNFLRSFLSNQPTIEISLFFVSGDNVPLVRFLSRTSQSDTLTD